MSLEAMKTINEAEEKARQMKAEAVAAAKKAVANAENAGLEAARAAKSRAQAESAHLLKSVEQKAEEEAQELAMNTENKKAAMRAHAESRMDEAASFIVGRIVGN